MKALRVTQIQAFEACQKAFYRRNIRREYRPIGIDAFLGSRFHEVAERNHRQKIETSVDISASDLIDYGAEIFDRKLKASEIMFTREEKPAAKKVIGEAKDMLCMPAGLIDRYSLLLAPTIQPLMVEQKISIIITSEHIGPITINGTLDVLNKDFRLPDIKSAGGSSPYRKQKYWDNSPQMYLYTVGVLHNHKIQALPEGKVFVKLKSGVELETYKANLTKEGYGRMFRRIGGIWLSINEIENERRAPAPAPLGSWKCCEKYCEYWIDCPDRQE